MTYNREIKLYPSLAVFTCNRVPDSSRCTRNQVNGTCAQVDGACRSRRSKEYIDELLKLRTY